MLLIHERNYYNFWKFIMPSPKIILLLIFKDCVLYLNSKLKLSLSLLPNTSLNFIKTKSDELLYNQLMK